MPEKVDIALTRENIQKFRDAAELSRERGNYRAAELLEAKIPQMESELQNYLNSAAVADSGRDVFAEDEALMASTTTIDELKNAPM